MAGRRTIGRIAKEVGVSVETIRFYERKGIIEQPQSQSGPRHYDDRQLAQVRYVRLAQRMGLSLKEIHALKLRLKDGEGFCASLRAVAEQKLGELAEETRRLEQLRDELTQFLGACRARAEEPGCPILDALFYPAAKSNATSEREGR